MNDNIEPCELDDRHCPICGVFIKVGSDYHKCSEKDLNKIYSQEEDKEVEENRTYDDKLCEFYEFYDSENYNDIDEEEL